MHSRQAATIRRLHVLHRILSAKTATSSTTAATAIKNTSKILVKFKRNLCGNNNSNFIDETVEKITIDDITKIIKKPINIEYVPMKYLQIKSDGTIDISQTNLHHLRWMLQKDELGQDIFLIGRPGGQRRQLAMQYLQLTQRELEYISLSRDTTESDLKQRREIVNGTSIYIDQTAVRAAIFGRILIIDGIEKAERNVLPILNNLLENREMHLEDGRFLIAAQKYDQLISMNNYTEQDLKRMGLIRVSENFRVIALGLPIPKYIGSPLDPPLRSRFQARKIDSFSYQELLNYMQTQAPLADVKLLQKLATFGCTIIQSNIDTLPDFPIDHLTIAAKLIETNPKISLHDVINHLYPYQLFLSNNDNYGAIHTLMESLSIPTQSTNNQLSSIIKEKLIEKHRLLPKINHESSVLSASNDEMIKIPYQQDVLDQLLQTYNCFDFCLIGPRGCGKSMLINSLAEQLHQTIEPIVIYQDMTARDLIQYRTTEMNGNTTWNDSPLIRAAKCGNICVLDGINCVHNSTITILNRLIHDRELQLYDGTRLIRSDKFNELAMRKCFTDQQMNDAGIYRIHPAFRIIAIAETSSSSGGSEIAGGHQNKNKWLTSELLNMFVFHVVRQLSVNEEMEIIEKLYGITIDENEDLKKLLNLAHQMRTSNDSVLKELSATLTTRQILRIARHMVSYPFEDVENQSLYDTILQIFLAKFLPNLTRSTLETAIAAAGIKKPISTIALTPPIVIKQTSTNQLQIGKTKYNQLSTNNDITKIPNVTFFNVPQHIHLMESLLKDLQIGSHLLLIGNQGVGKNKIIDRLLQLMKRSREYIQLHRDTTVQTLTSQTIIDNGRIVYDDSPLIKACRMGNVLIVDEADKAPIHVTCILKTLIDNGQMTLSDGRKLINSTQYNQLTNLQQQQQQQNLIKIDDNFRLILLANRPGYPFLGNNFYSLLGDLLSCHIIDNPSIDSEIYLLKQYAPNVNEILLKKFVNAFSALRDLVNTGQLSYPYSTREVINIVRHLDKYPNDNLTHVIGNVLDFEQYSQDTLNMVVNVLIDNDIDIDRTQIIIDDNNKQHYRRDLHLTIERKSGKLTATAPKHGKEDEKNEPHVGGNTWAGGTGGRDTAGLGGKGGPYRLDKGHQVHQLSDAEKNDVPDHILDAARAMNRKAFSDKLKNIKMSAYDDTIYQQFYQPIKQQIKQLRLILDQLKFKFNERQWIKHQTVGEFDDNKLIECITGDKNIYRYRSSENESTLLNHQQQNEQKPKRLRLIVDVSGSMYRFNGYDLRLDRQLELIVMCMESFYDYQNVIHYDIIGHSGESDGIKFVEKNHQPNDNKERLTILQMMHAHSQYCWAGDNTLAAARNGIESVCNENDNLYDDTIVVILSDANLSRYNIPINKFRDIIVANDGKCRSFVIFIGSLDDEAEVITKSMPPGRAFVCMDLKELPQILNRIFESSILL